MSLDVVDINVLLYATSLCVWENKKIEHHNTAVCRISKRRCDGLFWGKLLKNVDVSAITVDLQYIMHRVKNEFGPTRR